MWKSCGERFYLIVSDFMVPAGTLRKAEKRGGGAGWFGQIP
jgi:hypothetical protein